MLVQEDEAGAGLHVPVAHSQAFAPDTDADGHAVDFDHCLHYHAMEPTRLE